ncbi:NarL family two-component system sensor histidine kinase LiaS [Enterococcus sp. PF1-24]|uniref:sensor histidine kinase n=1 Tax=unclassified Enterococcus TaxID=2608891 RepID=UPI002475CC86|nr:MULTISPECIES: sensor histidine kinase [unclassified Enterococcus]MDH6363608.1 NarL family two-component system sensor histidine kinase LiaS [Enterococcus sp. PFB1-1]MDH6400843.1 NarL family two-component system sensor histidine kinase LiaS [Enterococcus sp. PF1-24]
MMKKISQPMLTAYTIFSTFILIIFILFMYFYASGIEQWWLEIFRQRVFAIPIIFYIVLMSVCSGFVTWLLNSFYRKMLFGNMEEKLRLLASGNYESPRLIEKFNDENNLYLAEMDRDITRIQGKMIEISRELQMLNARPQVLDGQTKEDILEGERQRLARELHDSVSQQLFAAMMMLSAINEMANQEEELAGFRQQLATVTNIINASQSEMRALLLHLRPINLEGKSLRQGIEQLLKELQTKIQIQLKWDAEDVSLQANIEDHLFRIVQELLSNTLRHAKAKELEVYLHKVGPNVLLRVVDDGVGFDVSESRAGSYGLNNIRERVAGVGGTVKIISFKNQGTSVEIKVPLLEEDND